MHKLFRRFFADHLFAEPAGLCFQPATVEDAGLSLPQRFCWHLVRRSRSARFIDCALGQAARCSVWNCDWPTKAISGCPAPDAVPTLMHGTSNGDLSHVLSILRRDASASSVVCMNGPETLAGNAKAISTLRHLAKTAAYLMLCSETGGAEGEPPPPMFANLCRQIGIHPAFTGSFRSRSQSRYCALGGREATPSASPKPVKALALMCTYNEEDIIEQTVASLFAQGLDVFVFDDGSTDSTLERLNSIARSSNRLILDQSDRNRSIYHDREAQFSRILDFADSAASMGYEWMMYVDADEIRCSPWPDVPLAEGFSHAEQMGYNAVDFTVIDFRYGKGQQMSDDTYERQMLHFEFGLRPGHFMQIKAWRHRPDTPVSLFPSRGHEAFFEGRRVFPLKFLLKHYPLRGLEQARKKIYQDRFPRYAPKELANGAHVQYNAYRDREPEGWDLETLPRWDDQFYSRYLLERLSGIGLVRNTGATSP